MERIHLSSAVIGGFQLDVLPRSRLQVPVEYCDEGVEAEEVIGMKPRDADYRWGGSFGK